MSSITIPEIKIPSSVEVPDALLYKTASGVDIRYINSGSQDVIRYSLVFKAGVKYQDRPFVASATVSMLSEGAADMSAHQVAEMLDFYGIYFDANIDRDYSVVTICALSHFADKALELLTKLLLDPHFNEQELAIYAAKRKQSIAVERQKVNFQARELFVEALYGADHPYGAISDENSYDTLSVDMLREFYNRHYNRNNLFAVVSGKVGQSDVEALASIIEQLPIGESADDSRIYDIEQTARVTLYKPDSLQSAIRIGKVLFDRMHPDFIGMQVVSTILGGYFGSRLVANLREDKGYTYGAFSAMINMSTSGYLAVSTEVRADATEDSVKQIYLEIARMRTEMVSEQELQMVKSVMVGEVMRILDGSFGVADVTIENCQNGAESSYISEMVKEIVEITPERVLALCQKYLQEDDFVEIIVGEVDADNQEV